MLDALNGGVNAVLVADFKKVLRSIEILTEKRSK